MGFMDKMKEAAGQAGDAAKKMGEAAKEGSDPRNIAPAQNVNRIAKEGIETPATLKSINVTGGKKFGGGTECTLVVDVQPAGGEPYEATLNNQLMEDAITHYESNIGGPMKVKVDPSDPSGVILWG